MAPVVVLAHYLQCLLLVGFRNGFERDLHNIHVSKNTDYFTKRTKINLYIAEQIKFIYFDK